MDKFLRRYFPGAGSGFLYRMLRKKNIVLNGRKASGNELLNDGDVIAVYFSDETFEHFRGGDTKKPAEEYPRLDPSWILYEDEHLIAVDKPWGLLSQKSRPEDVSLVEYLKGYLTDSGNGLFSAGIANRLDRNTSGIVIAGKDQASARSLSEAVRGRRIGKYYLAACIGIIDRKLNLKGTLIKDARTNTVRVSALSGRETGDSAGKGGNAVETRVRPLCVFGCPGVDPEKITLLEVQLITGKTHQIRAHLSSAGHALIGDPRYGNPEKNRTFRKQFGLERQFLHASRMEFPKMTGILKKESGLVIRCPLPEDLTRVLKGCTMLELFDRKWTDYE